MPDFSESQLQQLINTEITLRLYSATQQVYSPSIVSLVREHDLGWDTAFYFPWLSTPPHPDHKGCNLFIQYKLSELLGAGGGEYSVWGCPYMRFRIPHSVKSQATGRYENDYAQFDNLKELADTGYSTYYATNHIVRSQDLFSLGASQRLLDEIPFLDISFVSDHPLKVTFTEQSAFFMLFSDPTEAKMMKWENVLRTIQEARRTIFREDVEFVSDLVMRLEERLKVAGDVLFRLQRTRIADISLPERSMLEALLLAKYLRQYSGIHWYRV